MREIEMSSFIFIFSTVKDLEKKIPAAENALGKAKKDREKAVEAEEAISERVSTDIPLQHLRLWLLPQDEPRVRSYSVVLMITYIHLNKYAEHNSL